jgi:hypothetical protein
MINDEIRYPAMPPQGFSPIPPMAVSFILYAV